MRFKAPPAPKLPGKQPPTAAAKGPVPSDGAQFGAPQQDARQPIVVCLDWRNTLDISVEPDGAPKEWLRRHYPSCTAVTTPFNSASSATARPGTLGRAPSGLPPSFPTCATTPLTPFGEVVLTWKRVGQSGKAAAGGVRHRGRQQLRPQGVPRRRRPRHRLARRESSALRRAGRAPRVPQPAPTPTPPCQGTRAKRVPRGSWPPPSLCKGRPRTFSVTWQCRRLQLKRQAHRFPRPVKCTGFQHRL